MAVAKLLIGVILLMTLSCVVSASQSENTITDSSTGKKGTKKTDDMVNDMYTAFMMTKNVMSMMLMFVSPIIQIKGFGLSVMNTLINIGRFLLQMQATKRLQEMSQMHHVSVMPQVIHADHKVHKDPGHHYKDHEHHHVNHDNSVYIIKDHDQHDHGSWGDGDHAFKEDHATAWNKEPEDHWKTSEQFFPAPDHDHDWSSSQKFAYYAPSPVTHASKRQGSLPLRSLPPARASHDSGNTVGKLYPYFASNLTRFR